MPMHAMHLYTAPEQVSNIKDINMGTFESAIEKKGLRPDKNQEAENQSA